MELLKRVLSHLQDKDVIDFTCSLINIPSHTGNEKALADYLAGELTRLGLKVKFVDSQKGRPNVISHLVGETDEIGLILVGHIDTVPPDQGNGESWMTDPYEGNLQNNRLYGLGSADMKGGIAAIVSALKSVLASGVKLGKGLTLVFCVDEEKGSIEGMKYIAENKLVRGNLAIAADTTNMCVQGWFKGRTIFELETKGKTAHTSNPSKGINAVHHMVEILHKINHTGFKYEKHELLGSCTITVGSVRGGKDTNSIPEHCNAMLEVRTVPGQTGEWVKDQINEYIRELKEGDSTLDATIRIVVGKDPIDLPSKGVVLDVIQYASRLAIGQELELSKAGIGGGDLYFLWRHLGIPVINFGPGDVEVAHSPNEYVDVDKLIAVSKCYAAFILNFCEGHI